MFAGKKLLVLGASANEISLIKRAQQLGITVIATDSNTDWAVSPAKYHADIAWDVSWSDLEALEALCLENSIDGVVAGYSEFRVENAILLCERLGLPCYCTKEQLETTRDKEKFKSACRRHGVPTVKEYASPDDVDRFPVIVKPVDRGGSIGVGIAWDSEELCEAYSAAMAASVSKNVVIEEYIYKATKFDAYYLMVDGDITLLSSDDVIFAKNNAGKRVVQSGWVLPSKHHAAYVSKVDPHMRSMLRDLGMKNGYIFISGFVDESDEFIFFETGFRLCGGHLYSYFSRLGFPSNLDLFIFHALGADLQKLPLNTHPDASLKCATLNFYAKAGNVKQIAGFEEVAKLENCAFSVTQGRVGQECSDDSAILSKIGMVYFCSDFADDLMADMQKAYELISVEGSCGEDLVYDRIDPEVIRTWWD